MAPIFAALVRYGLGLIANAAMVKGTGWIKEKTGINLDENKTELSTEERDKLLQFQLEHEEELLKLQLENNKLGLEETKAYLADVQNARLENTAVLMSLTAPWYAKAIQPGLAAFVVVGCIVLFMVFVWLTGEVCVDVNGKCLVKDGNTIFQNRLNQVQRDIVMYVLGVLSAALTQILGYYFGSSQGSAKKTDILSTELDKSKD